METPSGQPGRAKRKGESEGRVRSCVSGRRRRLGPGPRAGPAPLRGAGGSLAPHPGSARPGTTHCLASGKSRSPRNRLTLPFHPVAAGVANAVVLRGRARSVARRSLGGRRAGVGRGGRRPQGPCGCRCGNSWEGPRSELGKGRAAEANAWGVGRGGLRGTNMSAFLFKQTETAGTRCACAARAFGREGASGASRTRTQAPARAGLAGRVATGRREGRRGRTWAGPGRRGGVGDAPEDRKEGDSSQLLVAELAGAPGSRPLGLWSGALLTRIKKALVITEIQTFLRARRVLFWRNRRVVSAPVGFGFTGALWCVFLDAHCTEAVQDSVGKSPSTQRSQAESVKGALKC